MNIHRKISLFYFRVEIFESSNFARFVTILQKITPAKRKYAAIFGALIQYKMPESKSIYFTEPIRKIYAFVLFLQTVSYLSLYFLGDDHGPYIFLPFNVL